MSKGEHDHSNEHTTGLKVNVVCTRRLAAANSWDRFPDHEAEEFVII
jgi:hypothetical protein